MSKKDEFVDTFKRRTGGQHPNDYKKNPKAFADILNSKAGLRTLFREAVLSEHNPTTEEEAAAGLGNLFKGCEDK